MTQKYKVYLNKKLIDAVFYADSDKVTKDEIKSSLVNHDGYSSDIKIVKCRGFESVKKIQADVSQSLGEKF